MYEHCTIIVYPVYKKVSNVSNSGPEIGYRDTVKKLDSAQVPNICEWGPDLSKNSTYKCREIHPYNSTYIYRTSNQKQDPSFRNRTNNSKSNDIDVLVTENLYFDLNGVLWFLNNKLRSFGSCSKFLKVNFLF